MGGCELLQVVDAVIVHAQVWNCLMTSELGFNCFFITDSSHGDMRMIS